MKEKNKYQAGKEKAREEAMFWQLNFAENNYSWSELIDFQVHFEETGKRYGLLKEFKENGII